MTVEALPGDTTRYRMTNLRPDTHYWFRVQASNAAGVSGVAEPDLTTRREPPAAPGTPDTTNLWATKMDVRWADRSGDETGFAVQVGTDGVTFREVGRTGAEATGLRVSGLAANTAYWVRMVAFNEVGETALAAVRVRTKK